MSILPYLANDFTNLARIVGVVLSGENRDRDDDVTQYRSKVRMDLLNS
jgi:hypothetical protein